MASGLRHNRGGDNMAKYCLKRHNPRSGQGLVEYVLVISLVAISLIIVLSTVGQIIRDNYIGNFNRVADAVLPPTPPKP